MSRFEILNVFLFVGVFPALWITAAVLDRFLPSDSSHRCREEVIGKVTGDAKLEAEGKSDKVAGKVQNAVGGLKDALRGK